MVATRGSAIGAGEEAPESQRSLLTRTAIDKFFDKFFGLFGDHPRKPNRDSPNEVPSCAECRPLSRPIFNPAPRRCNCKPRRAARRREAQRTRACRCLDEPDRSLGDRLAGGDNPALLGICAPSLIFPQPAGALGAAIAMQPSD